MLSFFLQIAVGLVQWIYVIFANDNSSRLKLIAMDYTPRILKNDAMSLLTHRLLLDLYWFVVNPNFVHGYETVQKLVRVSVEQLQTLFRSYYTIAIVVDSLSIVMCRKRGTHFGEHFLIHKWYIKFENYHLICVIHDLPHYKSPFVVYWPHLGVPNVRCNSCFNWIQ